MIHKNTLMFSEMSCYTLTNRSVHYHIHYHDYRREHHHTDHRQHVSFRHAMEKQTPLLDESVHLEMKLRS